MRKLSSCQAPPNTPESSQTTHDDSWQLVNRIIREFDIPILATSSMIPLIDKSDSYYTETSDEFEEENKDPQLLLPDSIPAEFENNKEYQKVFAVVKKKLSKIRKKCPTRLLRNLIALCDRDIVENSGEIIEICEILNKILPATRSDLEFHLIGDFFERISSLFNKLLNESSISINKLPNSKTLICLSHLSMQMSSIILPTSPENKSKQIITNCLLILCRCVNYRDLKFFNLSYDLQQFNEKLIDYLTTVNLTSIEIHILLSYICEFITKSDIKFKMSFIEILASMPLSKEQCIELMKNKILTNDLLLMNRFLVLEDGTAVSCLSIMVPCIFQAYIESGYVKKKAIRTDAVPSTADFNEFHKTFINDGSNLLISILYLIIVKATHSNLFTKRSDIFLDFLKISVIQLDIIAFCLFKYSLDILLKLIEKQDKIFLLASLEIVDDLLAPISPYQCSRNVEVVNQTRINCLNALKENQKNYLTHQLLLLSMWHSDYNSGPSKCGQLKPSNSAECDKILNGKAPSVAQQVLDEWSDQLNITSETCMTSEVYFNKIELAATFCRLEQPVSRMIQTLIKNIKFTEIMTQKKTLSIILSCFKYFPELMTAYKNAKFSFFILKYFVKIPSEFIIRNLGLKIMHQIIQLYLNDQTNPPKSLLIAFINNLTDKNIGNKKLIMKSIGEMKHLVYKNQLLFHILNELSMQNLVDEDVYDSSMACADELLFANPNSQSFDVKKQICNAIANMAYTESSDGSKFLHKFFQFITNKHKDKKITEYFSSIISLLLDNDKLDLQETMAAIELMRMIHHLMPKIFEEYRQFAINLICTNAVSEPYLFLIIFILSIVIENKSHLNQNSADLIIKAIIPYLTNSNSLVMTSSFRLLTSLAQFETVEQRILLLLSNSLKTIEELSEFSTDLHNTDSVIPNSSIRSLLIIGHLLKSLKRQTLKEHNINIVEQDLLEKLIRIYNRRGKSCNILANACIYSIDIILMSNAKLVFEDNAQQFISSVLNENSGENHHLMVLKILFNLIQELNSDKFFLNKTINCRESLSTQLIFTVKPLLQLALTNCSGSSKGALRSVLFRIYMYCAEKHLMDPLQYFPALVLFSSKACGNGQWISSRKQRLAQLEMQRCIAKYQDVLMARSVKESVIFLSVQKCNFIDEFIAKRGISTDATPSAAPDTNPSIDDCSDLLGDELIFLMQIAGNQTMKRQRVLNAAFFEDLVVSDRQQPSLPAELLPSHFWKKDHDYDATEVAHNIHIWKRLNAIRLYYASLMLPNMKLENHDIVYVWTELQQVSRQLFQKCSGPFTTAKRQHCQKDQTKRTRDKLLSKILESNPLKDNLDSLLDLVQCCLVQSLIVRLAACYYETLKSGILGLDSANKKSKRSSSSSSQTRKESLATCGTTIDELDSFREMSKLDWVMPSNFAGIIQSIFRNDLEKPKLIVDQVQLCNEFLKRF